MESRNQCLFLVVLEKDLTWSIYLTSIFYWPLLMKRRKWTYSLRTGVMFIYGHAVKWVFFNYPEKFVIETISWITQSESRKQETMLIYRLMGMTWLANFSVKKKSRIRPIKKIVSLVIVIFRPNFNWQLTTAKIYAEVIMKRTTVFIAI